MCCRWWQPVVCRAKSLLTHMVYFSVAMDCKSICPCHACVVCSLSFIFVCIQLLHISWRFSSVWHWLIPLSNLWFMLVRMAALVSGWGLRSQAEKTGCDKTLKPGAQHLSILAGVMWHWSGRVATAAQQPTILPITMSHSLLETSLFHSLLDLIYTFCNVLNNTGSWHCACFGTGRKETEHLRGLTK